MTLRIERYGKSRYWALYDGLDLVVVTLYKRGAQEVRRRLEARPPAEAGAAAQAAAVEAAERQAQALAALARALARQARAAAQAARAPGGWRAPPEPTHHGGGGPGAPRAPAAATGRGRQAHPVVT
jgi:hypothetical protein